MEFLSRYSSRGVSSSKEDVHRATAKLDKGLYPQAFCKILPDYLTGSKKHGIILHADGAGTKTALAYLYWKETGDLSVWKGIAQDAIVMNTDDLLCAGATDNFFVSSTIGRNKNFIPGKVISSLIEGTENFLQKLRDMGIRIFSAGGETEDIGDLVRTITVNATMAARIRKEEVIKNNIGPKDVIIGLASSGQTSYEKGYNSGIGSNGLTSARHDVLSDIYRKKYPETFDSSVNLEYIYCGKYTPDSPVLFTNPERGKPAASLTAGKLLLSPTRTYLPVLREILKIYRKNIHGLIHCTGGGQTKCLHFSEGMHIIKNNLFELPPVFRMIQESSGTDWKEMYQVFNMGHRLEIYLPEKYAGKIISVAKSFSVDAQVVGHCERAKERKLTLKSPFGEYEYY